jgi:cytochrome d ubiquinol oxidase subunit II
VESKTWRNIWDTFIFIGSFLPAVLFGVAFANIFKGIPIDQEGYYYGTLFTLLNPYGLLGGLLFLLLFLVHGSLWLCLKTEGALQKRAITTAKILWPLLVITAVGFLVASAYETTLYRNYLNNPLLFGVLLIDVAALLGIYVFIRKGDWLKAWASSAVTIVFCTFFGIVGMYPNLFPSSLNPEYSLTAFNASSSPLTLKIMLIVAVIFVPIVIAYQTWAYLLFKGKITEEDLQYEEGY